MRTSARIRANEHRTPMRELLSAYRWPLALLGICLILVLGALEFLRTLTPGAFRKADVTERFISSLPETSRTEGGLLEVSKVRVTETFLRSDEQFTAWGWISLGETVSEIRAPVVYRYHIKLSGDWKVEITGNICRVTAPPLEPSLPPAIDLREIERRTMRGWGRLDNREQMKKLETEMMARLERRAFDYPKFADVREMSRRTTAEFVEQWLLNNRQWQRDPMHVVLVEFADELKAAKP